MVITLKRETGLAGRSAGRNVDRRPAGCAAEDRHRDLERADHSAGSGVSKNHSSFQLMPRWRAANRMLDISDDLSDPPFSQFETADCVTPASCAKSVCDSLKMFFLIWRIGYMTICII